MSVNVSKVFNGSAWVEIRDPLVYNGSVWVRADSISSKAAEWTTGPLTGPGAPSWSPASLTGIYSWYDAQNAGSITKDGSNYVTQMLDKSGGGGTLEASGTSGPVLTANAINGSKQGLVFANASSLLSTSVYARSFLSGQTRASLVFAMKSNTNTEDQKHIYWTGSQSGGNRLGVRTSLYQYDGRLSLRARASDGEGYVDRFNDGASTFGSGAGLNYILRVDMDYAGGVAHLYLSTYGDTTEAMTTNALTSTSTVSNTYASVGSGFGTSNGGAGHQMGLGEVILVRGSISAGDITSLNAYLKAKWGF